MKEIVEDRKAVLSKFDIENGQHQGQCQSYQRNQKNMLLDTFRLSFKIVSIFFAELLL